MNDLIAELRDRAARGELQPDDELFEADNAPLSEAQLVAAEAELGLRLPELLRRIYIEVANGGFGTAYGLLGLKGGMRNEDKRDAVGEYLEYRQSDPDDPLWHWPEGLLPVGHLGCGMYLCVDCSKPQGPVTLFDPNPHYDGGPWDDAFYPFAKSTYDWIAAWVRGEDLYDKLCSGG